MSAADYGCRQPVYNSAGVVWATRTSGPHDWRLFHREKQSDHEYVQGNQPPGYGMMKITPTAWIETWYCTKCRVIDKRIVPIPEEES